MQNKSEEVAYVSPLAVNFIIISISVAKRGGSHFLYYLSVFKSMTHSTKVVSCVRQPTFNLPACRAAVPGLRCLSALPACAAWMNGKTRAVPLVVGGSARDRRIRPCGCDNRTTSHIHHIVIIY
jgi:hypothetical protein